MGYYFENHLSMFAATGWQVKETLNAITRKFVGNNPPLPMTYRAYSRQGILRGKDYRYEADFSKVFPAAREEQYVYAWAKFWSDAPATFMADVSCLGPMVIYLNGAVIFKSDIFSERYPDKRNRINLPLQAGWNHCVIRFKKTKGGFGGIFGTWLGKHPYYFVMPTPEREGGGSGDSGGSGQQEGWIFTAPMDAELVTLPGPGMTEASSGIRWLPEREWSAAERRKGQLERIFGRVPGVTAVAWTRGIFTAAGVAQYLLRGKYAGNTVVLVDDKAVFAGKGSGKINEKIDVPHGRHEVMVKVECPRHGGWGFELAIEAAGGEAVALESPCALVGLNDPWIYIGPFAAGTNISEEALRDLDQVHAAGDGDAYWRVDMPHGWVRPYNENALYGRWNYPLGVTLYGLLHSARAIGSAETQEYIVNHMHSCCATLGYALWDREQYGGATALHTLLSSIDSLDDCGSFGSAMLEVNKYFPIKGAREIADYVADYISNTQARLEDGTFYRKILMHIFHENTMWADDLYMSVPFLCRYAALTGDQKYLDDAARQFLGFKKRLYMPNLKIMSHIYDFRRDMATGVPWGRGNGWTIFSLSELLAVLPEKHALRGELLAFFRDLCAGYLALQDPDGPNKGMWHQVLTHRDAYPETSCTAMFAYAFARGVQFGWLENPEPYAAAVVDAWTAINKVSIDKHGNVHGVCRGSEFSFSPEYYKKELLPNLNDTHGVGIVLLAGVETLRMMEFLRSSKVNAQGALRRKSKK
ncbi:MAG TPA: glycoside hydrolase family 88 protein [Phycisphaerae bacterium]|nr:glycoside hydrolase family 88 protein [Phycisphaerae bacterium]